MAERRKIGNWIESGCLGSGTFGMVKLWYNEINGAKIALKVCRNDPPMSAKGRERWRQEVDFLKRIKHPNIIETRPLPKELVEEGCKESLPALCMEYCEGGDLRKTLSIAENCCGLKETMIIRVCEDIANAIECLHKEKIAHRDLKPENIVICPRQNKNIYKVIDLGYAKEADTSGLCYSLVGTRFYLAPEIVKGEKYTLKVDLWSYGILLYECCTGFRPFPLPYKELFESTKSKDENFITITVEEENDMLLYSDKLPPVNRLNCVLQRKFEELLRLLLDKNPTRRGFCQTENGTRSWRDCVTEIQNTKVIEVFCIDLYKQFVYEITSSFSLQKLKESLEKDTGIPSEHQELFTHDGSDLTSLYSTNANLMAFMFNKAFNPRVQLKHKPGPPDSLDTMLKNPDDFTKRSMKRHMEVYKHSVFFIHKQIANNKSLIRGLKALVIRLLEWSRQEFTVRYDRVSQRLTELESVVSFFRQSLKTDLKYCNSNSSVLKNGVYRCLPDFESWRRVEKNINVDKIMMEAGEISKRKIVLQSKIAAIKNHEQINKTPERSRQQLNRRAAEIQSRFEQMKQSRTQAEKSSSWKEKIFIVRDTITMTLQEIEKNNAEFYQFLRELFILRKELENFIPLLAAFEKKTVELKKKIQEWQQTRQEEIWKLLASSKEKEEKTENDEAASPQQPKPAPVRRRRAPGSELVKQSQAHLSRLQDTLKDVNSKQKLFENQIEDFDWSFFNLSDSEDTSERTEDK